jgi:hypothetical protein
MLRHPLLPTLALSLLLALGATAAYAINDDLPGPAGGSGSFSDAGRDAIHDFGSESGRSSHVICRGRECPDAGFSSGGAGCSPETRQKNVSRATDSLDRLSQNELRHAPKLRKKVAQLKQMRSSKAVADETLRIAGVQNPNDNAEVADLLSPAHDERPNVRAIQSNLSLEASDAALVYRTVRREMSF